MAARDLNDQQKRFVAEYLIDLNATAAAARSGYAHSNTQGPRLLGNVSVAAAIAAALAERARRCGIDADRVLKELAAVAFSDLGELIEFTAEGFRFKDAGAVSEAARRAVSGIKVRREAGGPNREPAEVVEFKLWPKVESLNLLGKHLGMWKEKDDPPAVPPSLHVHLTYEQLRNLPPDELLRIHRATLGLPPAGA